MRWSTPVSVVLHVAAVALVATQIAPRALPLPPPPLEVTLIPVAAAAPPPPALPPPVVPPEPQKIPPPPEPEPVKLPDPPPPEKPADPPPVRLAKPKVKPVEPPPVVQERPPEPVVEQPPPPPQQLAAVVAPPAPVMRADPAAPANYGALIQAHMQRNLKYPPASLAYREQGEAQLSVTIARNGQILAWRIVRSTGRPRLDQAVEEMVRRANPLPPIPADIEGEARELVIPVPITYRQAS